MLGGAPARKGRFGTVWHIAASSGGRIGLSVRMAINADIWMFSGFHHLMSQSNVIVFIVKTNFKSISGITSERHGCNLVTIRRFQLLLNSLFHACAALTANVNRVAQISAGGAVAHVVVGVISRDDPFDKIIERFSANIVQHTLDFIVSWPHVPGNKVCSCLEIRQSFTR